MHELDTDLWNGPRSNVNMPIEKPRATLCFRKSNVCPICHYLRDISSRNVYDLDPDLYNGPRSNINMPIENPHMTFYVLAIAMFVPSVTVCKIMTFELPNVLESNVWPWKWRSRKLTIWMKIGRQRYLVNMQKCMCIKKGCLEVHCLFAIHSGTFHECFMDIQTNEHTSIGPVGKHRSYAVGTV